MAAVLSEQPEQALGPVVQNVILLISVFSVVITSHFNCKVHLKSASGPVSLSFIRSTTFFLFKQADNCEISDNKWK